MRAILIVLVVLLWLAVAAAGQSHEPPRPIRVLIETGLGDIEVDLDAGRAPATATNFLKYVDGGFYDGGRFHRTVTSDNQSENKVRIAVVQAGVKPDNRDSADRRAAPFPAVPLERTSKTGLRHRDGVISMARTGPDSATSDFFICLGDQPSLDYGGARNPDGQGFAAFGRVVKGMDVVRRIQASPANGQSLTPPITIAGARRCAAAGCRPPVK